MKYPQTREEALGNPIEKKTPLLYKHAIDSRHPAPPMKPQPIYWPETEEGEDYDIPSTNPGETVPGATDKFAVFATHGVQFRQFKVIPGDRVMMPLLRNPSSGTPYDLDDLVIFNNVLLVGSRDATLIGRPVVPGAKVFAVVEEIKQLKADVVFKSLKRTKRHTKRYSRPWVTILKINEVRADLVNPEETHGVEPEFIEELDTTLHHAPVAGDIKFYPNLEEPWTALGTGEYKLDTTGKENWAHGTLIPLNGNSVSGEPSQDAREDFDERHNLTEEMLQIDEEERARADSDESSGSDSDGEEAVK